MKKPKTFFYVLSIILLFIFVYILQPIVENNIKFVTILSLLIICFVFYIFKKLKKEKINYKDIIFVIIIFGILIRAMYIVYTPITERQHDVYSIEDEGHLGYIYTIYETGKLPETNNIQFYHPPLFHSIAAGWLKINTALGVNLDIALEGIQILTAIFSSLIVVVAYKIVKKIKIKNFYKILIMSVMSFHPTFIILAGSINNDILMILLSFCIILYLINWYNKPNIKNTFILAIITGCCVMTKLSGAMMAVPILFVFIDKIIKVYKTKKQDLLKLFGKFVLFGIISLPLGLWHPIRNAILFNQPIGGVMYPSNHLYIGNYSITERFLSISIKELFGQIYCVVPGNYNIFAYIIKCSLFGEFSYNNINLFATFFKIINLILVILSIIFTVILAIKYNKKNSNYIIIKIILLTFFINIISYYTFNIEYPFTCTMDFRYIVPTIFTGITAIGIMLNDFIKNVIFKEILEYMIILFCILSFTLFFII